MVDIYYFRAGIGVILGDHKSIALSSTSFTVRITRGRLTRFVALFDGKDAMGLLLWRGYQVDLKNRRNYDVRVRVTFALPGSLSEFKAGEPALKGKFNQIN